MTPSIRLARARTPCLRQIVGLALLVACLLGWGEAAFAQIVTRLVVPGGGATTTPIFQGQNVVIQAKNPSSSGITVAKATGLLRGTIFTVS